MSENQNDSSLSSKQLPLELVELQTQLSFQEHTISQLNDALISQQQQIDFLKKQYQIVQEKYQELELRLIHPLNQPIDEKPPHY